MNAGDIILIIISGLGVIHGIFLGLFLLMYREGNPLSNKLLSFLLFVLSFRVGKSVFLEFTADIDVKIIFIGLSTIMAIGPLFYFFIRSSIEKGFRFNRQYLIHFIPTVSGLAFGFYISSWEEFHSLILIIVFLSYYLHFLVYLVISYRLIAKAKQNGISDDVSDFLMLMFFGLLAIWFVYVLNLLDEIVPYVIGPILYSVVAYVTSFIVFRKGYIQKIKQTKYKTNPVSQEQADQIYKRLQSIITVDKRYKEADVSLKNLSEALHITPQILSLVINQKSEMNFNSFINGYRVEEATRLLKDEQYQHQTIAAIAFQSGFNSISSFNTAFKNKTGKTPLTYRKDFLK